MPPSEIRAKVRELDQKYHEAKQRGDTDAMINLFNALCQLENQLERLADCVNVQKQMAANFSLN